MCPEVNYKIPKLSWIFLFVGYIRNHDDEVTETPDKSKMEQYEAETKRIWFEMYGTPLAITGNTCIYPIVL